MPRPRPVSLCFLPLFCGLVLASGCSSWSVSQRLDRLEDQSRNVQVLDMRLTHVENKLALLEEDLGVVADGAGPRPVPARPVAPPAPRPAVVPAARADGLEATLEEFRSRDVPSAAPARPAPRPAASAVSPDSPVPAPARPHQAPAAASTSPARQEYARALAAFEQGRTREAQQQFEAFLERHPGNALAPNALYWKGECFYSRGEYDAAILAFKDVAGAYPKHDKAAAALLKAGYAYAQLGDRGNARFYWQMLVDDYPASQPAQLARKRLAE